MKQRSTTPVSAKGIATKSALVTAAVLMAVALPAGMVSEVHAESISQLQARIDALKHKQAGYKSTANALSHKEDTLANKISRLNAQIHEMQTQIDISQSKADKLAKQIVDTKKKIAANKTMLGNTIADMYVDGSTTPLEMLASSKNIGDYLDKQTYQSTVSNQLSSTIKTITNLKKSLETKQKQVKVELANQKNTQAELNKTQSDKQQILNETKGKESAYRSLIKKNQSQQDSLSRQIADQMRRTINSGGAGVITTGGSGGGYPYNCAVDAYAVSPYNDGHGYGCSQCVSYAAWMMGQVYHLYPQSWGNADMFPGNAAAAGFHVSDTPHANSIVFFPSGVNGAGGVGHVGWVQGVSGNTITVSQYNYYVSGYASPWGHYSEMTFQHIPGMKYIYP